MVHLTMVLLILRACGKGGRAAVRADQSTRGTACHLRRTSLQALWGGESGSASGLRGEMMVGCEWTTTTVVGNSSSRCSRWRSRWLRPRGWDKGNSIRSSRSIGNPGGTEGENLVSIGFKCAKLRFIILASKGLLCWPV